MTMYRRSSVVILSLVFLIILCAANPPAMRQAWGAKPPVSAAHVPASWSRPAAAQYLDEREAWWLHWSGASRGQGTACLSCHTSLPLALARPLLGAQIGETTPGPAENAMIHNVRARVGNWEQIVSGSPPEKDPCVAYYGDRKPSSLGTESVLNALVLVNEDVRRAHGSLSTSANRALVYLWDQQQPDGSWLWLDFGLNPWERDGVYYGSALAAVAVGMAGKDYYDRPDLQPKVRAIRTYLRAQYAARPLHDRAACLWAASWLPGILTTAETRRLVQDLLNAQNADGGWSLPKLGLEASGTSRWSSQGVTPKGAVSDGYATGLVVLALKRAGIGAGSAPLQKGIAWLEANQKSGTWPANYINENRDPQTDIGKFMPDAAAAFAVMALTEPRHA